MKPHKDHLIHAVNTSVQELQQGLVRHCSLVASLLEAKRDEGRPGPLLDFCPRESRELRLKKAIKEAIEILEESRKAFKSKRLEALRKKLTQVLIDVD